MSRVNRRTVPVAVLTPALLLLALPLVGTGSSQVVLASPVEAFPGECELELRPAEVPRGDVRVTVVARLSEDIGEVTGATAQDRSGVEVAAAQPGPDRHVRLTLNTTEANEGEWQVTVSGEQGECSGQLRVGSR